jgi:hypothetical protein
MNLNNMILNPNIVADLYPASLVDNATSMPVSTTTAYIGNFDKKILIVTADKNQSILPSIELELLNGILKACLLEIHDVAIINFYDPASGIDMLLKEAKFVLLFGIDPLTLGLPINFPYYQLQSFDKKRYIYAPSLREVASDRTIKSSLWTSLKKLFGI